MPTYEYQCQACHHHFESFQKISDKPLTKCPECGKNKLQKLMSASAFQLKGGGWYVTDFRSKEANKKETDAATTESKADADDSKKKSETKADTKIETEVKTKKELAPTVDSEKKTTKKMDK